MSESVLVALITGGLSLIGVILTVYKSNQQLFAKLDKQSELSDAKLETEIRVIKTEIDNLADKVSKHNNLVERTYKLEGRMDEAEHDIRDLKARAS